MTTIDYASEPQVVEGPGGVLYQMVISGTAEVVRGPLGRFIDLADQIRSEGLEVPAEIVAALDRLQS